MKTWLIEKTLAFARLAACMLVVLILLWAMPD